MIISNKKNIFSILVFIILVLILMISSNKNQTPVAEQSTLWGRSELILNGKVFLVEIVDTFILREKGLSGHKPILDNEGMFFVFDKPDNYGFWMKDMQFPIDIIWLNKDLKIIYIEKSVSPNTYPKVFYPNSQAVYVLEINSGQSDVILAKIGDKMKIIKDKSYGVQ